MRVRVTIKSWQHPPGPPKWSAARLGPGGQLYAPQAGSREEAERYLAIGFYEKLLEALRRGDPRVRPLESIEFEVVEEPARE